MLKLLIKFWPAFIPITTYLLWMLLIREIVLWRKLRKKFSHEQTKKEIKIINQTKPSLLNDRKFFLSIFLSFLFLILSLLYFAFISYKDVGNKYIPAKYENGKIIPAKKI